LAAFLPCGLAVILSRDFPFQESRPGTARRTPGAVAQLSHVNFQFRDSSTEGVAVHAEFARGAALVTLIFLEHREDEALLEFAYCFGVKNVALVHLHDEGFKLIFHGDLSFFQRLVTAILNV
jgi:hypothetical protein